MKKQKYDNLSRHCFTQEDVEKLIFDKLGKKLKTFIKSKNEVRPYGLWMTEKAEVEVIDEFPLQKLELKHGHSTTGEESHTFMKFLT